MTRLLMRVLPGRFAFCKLDDTAGIDLKIPYCFAAVTDEEISLVCLESDVPARATETSGGWRALAVCGKLDFSLVGIASRITGALAERGISTCVVSTFDTDYFFVREQTLAAAVEALSAAGCGVK